MNFQNVSPRATLEPLWKSALNHTQLSGTSENESYVSVFFSVWVCLGKCVSVFGEWLDPELAELVVRVWGQVVSQWPADWHHLYCPNNRSIWLSSQASIYPNCIKSNRKNETLIKANQYPAPQLWPEDLGMAGAAVICTLLTPMSATLPHL